MENNNELNLFIKSRTCYYFHDIIIIEDLHFDNILFDKKTYENILVCNISYKTMLGSKPLGISFNKIGKFIKVYDPTRYLVLFDPEKYDVIYNRIRNFKSKKWNYIYVFS